MKSRFHPNPKYAQIGRITGVETMPRLNLLEWFLTYGLKDDYPEISFAEAVEVFCYEMADWDRPRLHKELSTFLVQHPNAAAVERNWLHLSGALWFAPGLDCWAVLKHACDRLV